MPFRIVTWKMNPRAKEKQKAWDFLRYELAPDIALVQDAISPEELGQGEQFIYPKEEKNKSDIVASGIWARNPIHIEQVKIDSVLSRRLVGAEITQFEWPRRLYVFSMFGRHWKKSQVSPNLHSMISDLHPFLEAHKGRIILGGDWYIDSRYNERYPYLSPLHKLIFERLEDRYYGLKRCNKEPLRTFYHSSGCSYQNDYLYASETLFWRLIKCETVMYPRGSWFSDHFPVLAEWR